MVLARATVVVEPWQVSGFPLVRDLVVDRSAFDGLLPQGRAERWSRTERMVEIMKEYFGSCTNHGECEKTCPKSISIELTAEITAY